MYYEESRAHGFFRLMIARKALQFIEFLPESITRMGAPWALSALEH